MTKYKLLQDLPYSAKGHTYKEDGTCTGGPNFDTTRPGGVNEEIALCIKLKGEMFYEWFEEVKEPKSIYELKDGDKIYFYIDDDGCVRSGYVGVENDRSYLNAFLTKEEAEKELAKRKAIATIKKWSWQNDNGEIKDNALHYMELNTVLNEIIIRYNEYYKLPGIQYYSSREKAKQAFKELETEYKTLFDID